MTGVHGRPLSDGRGSISAFPSRARRQAGCALAILVLASAWLHPHSAQLAYIGPGAGFAFLGSFLTLVAGFFLSVVSFLLWPFRMAWRAIRRRKSFHNARVEKIIFLGLDG